MLSRRRATRAIRCTGAPGPHDIRLMGVRWYVASPLRTRRSTGGGTYRPQREEALQRRTRPVWMSWRRVETSMPVQGAWRSLDRAVATHGQPLAWLLPEHRAPAAALPLRTPAIRRNGLPETSTRESRDAKAAARKRSHEEHGTAIASRQGQYWQNVGAQEQRAVKRVTRPR